jgi:hypothetical protein
VLILLEGFSILHPQHLKNIKKLNQLKMRRLFKKGERVRSKIDGKVMEVLKYIKSNWIQVKSFDLESKEVRTAKIKEDKLSKAA